MNNTIKNFFLGAFLLCFAGLLSLSIFFLKHHMGDEKQKITVRFSEIQDIIIGTKVLFAGKPIGRVADIHFIHNARKAPTENCETVYFYELTLLLDSKVPIYATDVITTHITGVFGEKSVSIIPKFQPENTHQKLASEEVLYAQTEDLFSGALKELSSISQEFTHIKTSLIQLMDDCSSDTRITLHSLRGMADSIEEGLCLLKNDLFVQLRSTLNTLERNIENFSTGLEPLRTGEFGQYCTTTLKNLSETSTKIQQILNGDSSGFMSKILAEQELYDLTLETLSRTSNILDNVQNYGFFFNSNRRWKKEKEKKCSSIRRW